VFRDSSLADILEGIPPTFSRKPKAVCVNEGANVILECHLFAVPEPDISWSFNDKPIKENENAKVSLQSDMHSYVSKLTFKNIKKNAEGVYSVLAKNREGEAKVDITLKVSVNLRGSVLYSEMNAFLTSRWFSGDDGEAGETSSFRTSARHYRLRR
jgi:hypothetical protein